MAPPVAGPMVSVPLMPQDGDRLVRTAVDHGAAILGRGQSRRQRVACRPVPADAAPGRDDPGLVRRLRGPGRRAELTMTTGLDALRSKGLLFLVAANWLFTAVLAVFYLTGTPDAGLWLVCSAATNVIPSWMALRHRHDLAARLSAAIMIVVQPAAIVAVNRGGEWQMDMHMYFFANLAALTILGDWRPIMFASALIGVHHLLLNWFAPGLVFRCAPNRRWPPPRRPIAEQRWKPRRTPG